MPQQARAHATRQQIIEAAARLFGSFGYAVGIADIAREAAVNKGSLYFHFASKEALAHEIIRLQHQASLAVDDDSLGGCEPLTRMIAITIRMARQAATDPIVRAGLRLTLDAASFEAPPHAPFTQWLSRFTELLEESASGGVVHDRVPARQYAFIAVAIYTGAQLVIKSLGHTEESLHSVVGDSWRALLPALLADRSDVAIERILTEAHSAA